MNPTLSQDNKVLRIVTTFEGRFDVLRNAVERFEENYSGVKVKIEVVHKDMLTKKTLVDYPPDIIEIKSQDYPYFIKHGLVVDLLPYLYHDKIDLNGFYDPMIELMLIDHKLAAIPSLTVMPALYYNKTLFDESNLPYPQEGWTWDEFEQAAIKLTKKDKQNRVTQYGCFIPTDDLYFLELFSVSNGGSFLSSDGTHSFGYLNGQKTVEAVQQFVNIFKQNLSPYRIRTLDFPKVAMHCMTSVLVPLIKQNRKNIGVVSLPQFKKRVSFLAVRGFGISSSSPHQELAWQFLKESILPYHSIGKEWSKWQMATTKKLAEESGQLIDTMWQPFFNDLNHLHHSSFLKNNHWEQLRPQYNQKVIELIKGDREVSEVLSEWTQEIDLAIS